VFVDTGGYWDLLCINSVANRALALALALLELSLVVAVHVMELRWMLIDTGGGRD
jgi:hypothetical protein